MTLDDDDFRIADHDAAKESGGIELTSFSSLRRVAAEREEAYGRDIGLASSRLEDVHRSAGNLTADATEHPCNVLTSSRHCYSVPRQPGSPGLLGSFVLNRNVPMRAIAAFAPGNARPPIREPNVMPEKRDERKNEEKNREEKKKKPIIRTAEESIDSGEGRAIAENEPDAEKTFRYEWGVKLAETPSDTAEHDIAVEKERPYVMKRLWGVNLKHSRPDVITSSPDKTMSEQIQNVSTFTGDDPRSESSSMIDEDAGAASDAKDSSDLNSIREHSLHRNDPNSSNNPVNFASRSKATSDSSRKSQEMASSNVSETVGVDDDYNIPANAAMDAEIVAWKNLGSKSQMLMAHPEKESFLSAERVENLQMVSIRPEAPQPKLDVRVVRSMDDNAKDEEQAESESIKSAELKRPEEARKFDNYTSSKKLHTASWQIRYVHGDTRSVGQRYNDLLPAGSAAVDATMSALATFSTESEDSIEKERMMNKASSEETAREEVDAKAIKASGEENEDGNASDSLSVHRSMRSQMSNNETDIITKTLNRAEEESTISSDQPLLKPVDSPKITQSSATSNLPKDEAYLDNMQYETGRYVKYERNNNALENDTYDTSISSMDEGHSSLNTINTNLKIKKNSKKDTSAKEEHGPKTIVENAMKIPIPPIEENANRKYLEENYVRVPGDTYPYTKEHLDKWRTLYIRNIFHTKHEDAPQFDQPISKSPNKPNVVAESRDSHGGLVAARTTTSEQKRRLSDSSQEETVNTLEMQRWTEAFSRLDGGAEKTNEPRVVDDGASLRR